MPFMCAQPRIRARKLALARTSQPSHVHPHTPAPHTRAPRAVRDACAGKHPSTRCWRHGSARALPILPRSLIALRPRIPRRGRRGLGASGFRHPPGPLRHACRCACTGRARPRRDTVPHRVAPARTRSLARARRCTPQPQEQWSDSCRNLSWPRRIHVPVSRPPSLR